MPTARVARPRPALPDLVRDRWLWLLAHLVGLYPLALLVWRYTQHDLGVDPIRTINNITGRAAIILLGASLAATPIYIVSGYRKPLTVRRALGLYAFFYALLHFLAYAWLDMGFDAAQIARDIPKRPFALVGFLALLLMLPLAATSFNRAIRALGAARWQALHRAVYAIAVLAILHFFWMRAGKHDFAEVAVYAAIVAALLGWRALRLRRLRQAGQAPARAAAR